MNEKDVWVELYDPKEGRKLREIPMQFKCKECECLGGHRLDCSSATKEQLYRIAKTAQHTEEQARKRADRYWQMLQQYQGKLAVLRHENNKLRKANSKRLGNPGGSEQQSSTERLPQRFRYLKSGCNGCDFGVCIPCGNLWSVQAGAGFGSFEADPWEIVGHIIGDVEAFEWIDNDYGWEGQ